MSKVYLVRHGQSEANINKIWGGDYPLTELGKEQAATVSGNIPEKPDAVYASCKKRAIQTAQTAYPEYNVTSYPEFDEIFTGSLEETTYNKETAIEVRSNPKIIREVYGGDDLNIRAEAALAKIKELAEGHRVIVIVSSDYLICSVLSLMEYGTADRIIEYKMKNCDNVCLEI